MNINRLKKKKVKAVYDGNLNTLYSISKELAESYFEQEMYEDALQEYKQMERISDTNGNRMDLARCNRMIGEVYCGMGDFTKALKHQMVHLKIATEEQDLVEKQRALATIGRSYFLQAESITDLRSAYKLTALENAKINLLQSLEVCEQLNDNTVGVKQKMIMRSRVFLNLGLVLESQNMFNEAVDHLSKAIMITKKLELWEELMRAYSALASVYYKKRESKNALSTFDQAVTVAERLPDKGVHIATILGLKAEVLVSLPDFLGARQTLCRAYKQHLGNNVTVKMETEKKLRIVAAMCETEKTLTSLSPEGNFKIRKKLYEDLGDMASELGCFSIAITYYHLMLENAEESGSDKKEIIESYESLAQTYKDDGHLTSALEYFNKELQLEQDNPSEACKTLLNIAELYCLLGAKDEMVKAYEKAKHYSQLSTNDKLKKSVLECSLRAFTDANYHSKAEVIQKELAYYNELTHLPSSESEEEDIVEKKQFGADICLDDLSDAEAVGGEDDDKRKVTRTRVKPRHSFQKKNEKGETPLHIAAISGNEVLVAKLIDQGHSVDVKDYSGWTPLHEACNHGHKEVVELLVSKGATVNDRGGPHCDGVTPLLDAASNGSLDCIEILLRHGASPLMKTNNGESVLDCLGAWRQRRLQEIGADLDDSTLAQYHSIYKNIQQILEKAGHKVLTKEFGSSKGPNSKDVLQAKKTDLSIAKNSGVPLHRKKGKDKDSKVSQRFNEADYATDEYENAMRALRFRHQQTVSPMAKPTVIPALLPSDECVGDNWLEDDLDVGRPNKKRRVCEFGGGQPQRKTGNSNISSTEIRRTTLDSPLSEGSIREDSSDSEDTNIMLAFKNYPKSMVPASSSEQSIDVLSIPSTSGIYSNKLKEMNAVRRQQISLMATGVSKEKLVKISEQSDKIEQCPGQLTQGYKFTCVKVRVEGKLLLVPLPQTASHSLTISWLANELATRYRSLEGIEPVLRIETEDGALFVDSDPVTLLLDMNELIGRVQSWKLPPLSTIYQEACHNVNIDIENQIITELDACLATNSVNLEDYHLDCRQLGPLLKALSYHVPLQVLSLSGSNLSDTYIKDVGNCVIKLSQLKSLDISNTNITSTGLATFVQVIVENKALQRLEYLNIGNNSLTDSLPSLAELLNVITSLRTLKLPNVNLTQESFRSCPYYSLDTIENLDISFNEIENMGVLDILGRLNHHVLIELKMAGTGSSTIREVAFFLQHVAPQMLIYLDLSYCSTTDYEINELIKGIEKCEQLARLCLDGISGISHRTVELLVRIKSIKDLSLCGLAANQHIQLMEHLSKLAITSCVDQAWATQRGPFGLYVGDNSVRQRTTTH